MIGFDQMCQAGFAGIVLRRFEPTLRAPNPLDGRRKADMADFSELPLSERAKRYRQLAEDALREAELADDNVRQSYLLIAEQWTRLAQVDGGPLGPLQGVMSYPRR